jgi:hypothetical protein
MYYKVCKGNCIKSLKQKEGNKSHFFINLVDTNLLGSGRQADVTISKKLLMR